MAALAGGVAVAEASATEGNAVAVAVVTAVAMDTRDSIACRRDDALLALLGSKILLFRCWLLPSSFSIFMALPSSSLSKLSIAESSS